jgi:cytidylate kinase
VTRRPGSGATPLVAEILGPPGAGKSTVLDAVARHAPGVRTVRAYRSARTVSAYLGAAAEVAPVLVCAARDIRGARQRLNWMVRLQASPRILRVDGRGADVVLFDQGPAYTLVRLHDRAADRAGRYGRWWSGELRRWAGLFDLVVLLDAPDDVLLERIRTREKPHAVKDVAAVEARQALAEYRARCQVVVRRLAATGSTRIVRVDTSASPQDAVVAVVLGVLGADVPAVPDGGARP